MSNAFLAAVTAAWRRQWWYVEDNDHGDTSMVPPPHRASNASTSSSKGPPQSRESANKDYEENSAQPKHRESRDSALSVTHLYPRLGTKDSCPPSPLPPVLTASSSGDTAELPHHDPLSLPDCLVLLSQPTGVHHVTSSTMMNTPEGLKPRRCLNTIREELNVPKASILTSLASINEINYAKRQEPSKSQAPASTASELSNRGDSSAGISYGESRSNEYSQISHGDTIAIESPNLLQARTAVGAVVAESTPASKKPVSRIGKPGIASPYTGTRSILPPSHALSRYENNHVDDDDDDEGDRYGINEDNFLHKNPFPYYPLEDPQFDDYDPIQSSRTPMVVQHTTTTMTLSPLRQDLQNLKSVGTRSPLSTHTDSTSDRSSRMSIRPSPSSLAAKQDHNNRFASSCAQAVHLLSNSYHNGSRTARQGTSLRNGEPKGYDLASILAEPAIITSTTATQVILCDENESEQNLSAMSHSAVLEDNEEEEENAYEGQDEEPTRSGYPSDGEMLQRKANVQRRAHEDLFVAILERLQDNIQLVVDIEAVEDAGIVSSEEWFVKTPLDKEGLLVGFSKESREKIVEHMTNLLHEMEVSPIDEFFLTSPSDIQLHAEPHSDLKNSLLFCRHLVQLAIPESERTGNIINKWLFTARDALGILPVYESPVRRRGGDTSVFSLPGDSMAETPMTSNVSITTTITSAVTSPLISNVPNVRSNGDQQPVQYPGLQLRRTIEIVATILQKISSALSRLLEFKDDVQESIRITEDLKRNYLQLSSIDLMDMKALVQSFELDDVPVQICSNDTEDVETTGQPFIRRHTPILPPPPAEGFERLHGYEDREGAAPSRDQFYSPSTVDSSGWDGDEEDEYEIDDLRRQVGSTAYDECEGARDKPDESEYDDDGKRIISTTDNISTTKKLQDALSLDGIHEI